ncbi:MAG: response regulator [Desulfurivibrionaceae bacterium]
MSCSKMEKKQNGKENIKILVVGGKTDNTALTSSLLSSHGFQCLTAAGGLEAIDIIQESEIHLVITEMDLPDINGIQLTNYIKRVLPDTEVVIIDEPEKGFSSRELSITGTA